MMAMVEATPVLAVFFGGPKDQERHAVVGNAYQYAADTSSDGAMGFYYDRGEMRGDHHAFTWGGWTREPVRA